MTTIRQQPPKNPTLPVQQQQRSTTVKINPTPSIPAYKPPKGGVTKSKS